VDNFKNQTKINSAVICEGNPLATNFQQSMVRVMCVQGGPKVSTTFLDAEGGSQNATPVVVVVVVISSLRAQQSLRLS